MSRRGELSALRREDGAVVVPPSVAGEVLRLLARALLDDARAYGGQPSPAARALLAALYEATQQRPDPTDPATPAARVLTVTEAAARMGCSTRWVRKLLADGRLPGHRSAAGVWLVHVPTVPTSEANRGAA